MTMAHVASLRSVCARRVRVGAVVTDASFTAVLSMGYNGPARGIKTSCTPTPDVAGTCTCVHAEENAIIKAPYTGRRDLILFCTMSPCAACARRILNADIAHVVFDEPYRDAQGLLILTEAGISIARVSVRPERILASLGGMYIPMV